MTAHAALFYLLAGLIVFSAVGMVQARNLFHAGLALITCFLGVAGIYVLLNSPFIAALQVLIYAGAVAVILLFGFMLTHHVMDVEGQKRFTQQAAGLGAAAATGMVLVAVVLVSPWNGAQKGLSGQDELNVLGQQLLTTYLLPFELASVFLLAALVAAIMIARKEEGPPPA